MEFNTKPLESKLAISTTLQRRKNQNAIFDRPVVDAGVLARNNGRTSLFKILPIFA